MRRTRAVALLVFALSTTSTIALAQAVGTATSQPVANAVPQPGNGPGLQEVIVTATRRAENLQNVPVSVTAVTASDLKKQGVFNTTDLNHALPNLQVSSPYGEQQPNFSIRGVGVGTEFNANAASPVGVYVDEVYQAFRSSHGQQLYDLNQIEVVRGPQGTLYGRNTTGGAINFITNQPRLGPDNGYITLGYGDYNRFNAEGAFEHTAIDDKFGIRVAATYVNEDPYIKKCASCRVEHGGGGRRLGLEPGYGPQPGWQRILRRSRDGSRQTRGFGGYQPESLRLRDKGRHRIADLPRPIDHHRHDQLHQPQFPSGRSVLRVGAHGSCAGQL